MSPALTSVLATSSAATPPSTASPAAAPTGPIPARVQPAPAVPVPAPLPLRSRVRLQRQHHPQVPRPSSCEGRTARQRRHPPPTDTPRLPTALPHRARRQQPPRPHRRQARRPPQPQHHPGLRRDLPAGRLQPLRPVPRTPKSHPPQPRIPRTHPRRAPSLRDHFGRRCVNLGDCVRPYGSGCTHEHACIRCNFLHVHPDAAARPTARTGPSTTLEEASTQHWLADVEVPPDATAAPGQEDHHGGKRGTALRIAGIRGVPALDVPAVEGDPAAHKPQHHL